MTDKPTDRPTNIPGTTFQRREDHTHDTCTASHPPPAPNIVCPVE